jgi:hypothetical protein
LIVVFEGVDKRDTLPVNALKEEKEEEVEVVEEEEEEEEEMHTALALGKLPSPAHYLTRNKPNRTAAMSCFDDVNWLANGW